MYKKRIRAWGLDKKFKRDDVLAILHAMKAQKGSKTLVDLRLRGRKVDEGRLVKYLRRNRAALDRFKAGDVPTTGGLVILGPERQSPLPPPRASLALTGPLQDAESLFSSMQCYAHGAFESGLWYMDADGHWLSRKGNQGQRLLSQLIGRVSVVWRSLNQAEDVPVFSILDPAFRSLAAVIEEESPALIGSIMGIVDLLRYQSRNDLLMPVLKHAHDITSQRLGEGHILQRICRLLLRLAPATTADMCDGLFAVITTMFRQRHSGFNRPLLAIFKQRWHLIKEAETRDVILKSAFSTIPPDCINDPLAAHLRLLDHIRRIEASIEQNHLEDARKNLESVAEYHNLGGWVVSWQQSLLGQVNRRAGDFSAAEACFRDAYRLAQLYDGWSNETWIQHILGLLDETLGQAGRHTQQADVIQLRRNRLTCLGYEEIHDNNRPPRLG